MQWKVEALVGAIGDGGVAICSSYLRLIFFGYLQIIKHYDLGLEALRVTSITMWNSNAQCFNTQRVVENATTHLLELVVIMVLKMLAHHFQWLFLAFSTHRWETKRSIDCLLNHDQVLKTLPIRCVQNSRLLQNFIQLSIVCQIILLKTCQSTYRSSAELEHYTYLTFLHGWCVQVDSKYVLWVNHWS